MINEIVKKIDAEIEDLIEFRDKQEQRFVSKLNGIINGLKKAKKIILIEQKSGTDINVAAKTKGDVIRESNESLAEWYTEKTNNVLEQLGTGCRAEKEKVLDRLNQPQEDTNE